MHALAAVPTLATPNASVWFSAELLRSERRTRSWAYACGHGLAALALSAETLLAAVFNWLSPLQQPAPFALDVALHMGALRDARAGTVSFASDVRRELATLPLRSHARSCSNVAVTLLGPRAELALSDLERTHDLHFIFHQQPSGLALLVAYDHGMFHTPSMARWVDEFVCCNLEALHV